MFDLEHDGQYQGVKQSQWSHSMANINLYKRHKWTFLASSHRFYDCHIPKFVTLILSTSWCTTFAIDDKDINGNVCSISHHLRDVCKTNKIAKAWPWKWRSKWRRRKTGLVPFDWKCPIPYKWFLFRISATWELTFMQKADTYTQRETGIRGDDYRHISAKQICLKT